VRSFEANPLPAMARIETFADGSFQFTKDGKDALICPVEMDGGEAIDEVAWFALRPAEWWLRRRIATHLGDRALRDAAFLGKPIRLLSSPAEWIASSEGAITVLDWTCDLRALFREVPAIRCATPVLRAHLIRRLAEQVAPRFNITVVAQ
jgi:hypothetical protein